MPGRHGGDGDDGTAGWLRGQLADALGRLRKADTECARLRAELEEARQHIRAQDEVDRILAVGLPAVASGETGPIARVQGPRAGGHRAPRDRGHLRIVKVVAFIVALSGLGLKGRVTRGAVRVGLAALLTAPAVGVAAGRAHLSPFVSIPPASALGPAWHTTGTPMPAASMLAVTRPRTAVVRSRPLVAPVPPPCPAQASPSPSPSSPSPSPSVSQPVPQPSWDPQQAQDGHSRGGRERDGQRTGQPSWQSPSDPPATVTPSDPPSSAPATPPPTVTPGATDSQPTPAST